MNMNKEQELTQTTESDIAVEPVLAHVISGCEIRKCHYYIDGKCTDPIDWKNEDYESVCGYRDDAIHPDDLP